MKVSNLDLPVSSLDDDDMRAVPAALARAAVRARETARLTGTGVVVARNGRVVIEEAGQREKKK